MKQDYNTSVPPKDLEASRKERAFWLAKWKFEPISFMILDKIHDPVLDAIVEDTLSQNILDYISGDKLETLCYEHNEGEKKDLEEWKASLQADDLEKR